MICKITNFFANFFNRKKFVKFEFSIYGLDGLPQGSQTPVWFSENCVARAVSNLGNTRDP